jgi:5S rRNA maturation endonuclease (ribonuclease M5)
LYKRFAAPIAEGNTYSDCHTYIILPDTDNSHKRLRKLILHALPVKPAVLNRKAACSVKLNLIKPVTVVEFYG